MFLFAHIGITLGAATLVSGAITKWLGASKRDLPHPVKIQNKNEALDANESFTRRIGLNALSRFLDIRILIIGSLVPDIIDKPLSFLGFGNGRYITHTLLISLIVLLIAIYLYGNYRQTWLLAIGIGMCTHLILDSMWATPQTLLWPLYGWAFPAPTHRIGLEQINLWWNILINNPAVDISEAIGLAILVGFIWILVSQNKFKTFLVIGKV